MIASGYQSKSLTQEIPKGLLQKSVGHDVVIARTNRNILPNGNASGLAPGGQVQLQISSSSEWVDIETAMLNFEIVLNSDVSANVFFKNGNASSLFKGYTIECKGQSLEPSKTQNLVQYNSLSQRLYNSYEGLRTSRELTEGTYRRILPTGADNFIYSIVRNDVNNKITYQICCPLREIVDFAKINRSILPIFAIPLILKLTLSDYGQAFVSSFDTKVTPTTYTVNNFKLSMDFLTMDQSVDMSFRKMVMNSQVSFLYPSAFITSQTTTGNTSFNLKENLNCSNLNAVYMYPTKSSTGATSLYPTCTTKVWDTVSMKNCNYNLYIDSRNVYGEDIRTAAHSYSELKKSTMNQNEKSLVGCPLINSRSFINGYVSTNVDAQLSYEGIQMSVIGIPLNRVLQPDSISGVNTSLTGGRVSLQVQGLSEAPDETLMFYCHTRELVISESFLQVIA